MENEIVGNIYAIYGAGGYGREVMPLARKQLKNNGEPESSLYFVVDSKEEDSTNGHSAILYEEFLSLPANEKYVVVAIADSEVREKLTRRCQEDGIRMWNVEADNIVKMDEVVLGEGSILSPFVTITSNVKIGKGFHANIYSYVAHDCVIGDYVTFAPAVKCNGNVTVEDHAYIGTGAIIRPGSKGNPLVIGKNAIVGMGAVVTKSVPAGATVFGNPAKILQR